MIYKRRYIQFNDLVIDGYDMISDMSGDVSFKSETQPYTNRHGSYVAFKRPYMLVEESEVAMTLKFKMHNFPCNMREFYRTWVIEQLTQQGKLWAVQNNELVWAYAYITNYSEDQNSPPDELHVDVNFMCYEGVWHKADKQKTFIREYDPCEILECEGFQKIEPCVEHTLSENCCDNCGIEESPHQETCECCCDDLEPSMALCYFKDYQAFYGCNSGYKIEYNCAKGEEFFGDEYLGTRLCKQDSCQTVIAGQVYSDTDIPTDEVTLIINGGSVNPSITINGNTNIIKGEYKGALTIKPNGDIIHTVNCCDEVIDPSAWFVPMGNDYGWEMHRGKNRVVVSACCDTYCVYVQVDGLTI